MHVSLTEKLEEYARGKVDSGLYNNGSEVVREALRLMIQRDADRERLRASIAEGFQQIEDGNYTEVSSRDELLALARARRTQS
jgi:antitoxin ParD1/3/4